MKHLTNEDNGLEIMVVKPGSDVITESDYYYLENVTEVTKSKVDKWMQGFVCAICILLNCDKCAETSTKELFSAGGIKHKTLYELKEMGVDEIDLETLALYWDQLHN